MNGLSEKEERDQRNDEVYARWSRLHGDFTCIHRVGRLHQGLAGFSGRLEVSSQDGRRLAIGFAGLPWQAIAAFTYAMHCSKAHAKALKFVRGIIHTGTGLTGITEIPIPPPSREQSLKQIRKLRKKDKPGYLLGMPIR